VLTETGTLPSGVTFVDNGNGTATLAGTAADGTAGTYPITITAFNDVAPDATQAFTLTVNASQTQPTTVSGVTQFTSPQTAPVSTLTVTFSGPIDAATFGVDDLVLVKDGTVVPLDARVQVTPTSGPSATFTISGLEAFTAQSGNYALAVLTTGVRDANGSPVYGAATTSFVVQEPAQGPPHVLALRRSGVHYQPTVVTLSFDQPMNPLTTQYTGNYLFAQVVHGRPQLSARYPGIAVTRAVYDPASESVALSPAQRLNLHKTYEILVNGSAPYGVSNQFGVQLAPTPHGAPGGLFTMQFGGYSSLAGVPAPGQPNPFVLSRPAAGAIATAAIVHPRMNPLAFNRTR
jgi:hypothetical protein